MSYHNLAKHLNGDHILYSIYDIVLPAFPFLKPKLENLDPYHCRRLCIDFNGLFGSLEREESRGEESSPPPCLDVFKISKGEESN